MIAAIAPPESPIHHGHLVAASEVADLFELELDKLKNHVLNEFLPYCVEQESKGEKREEKGEEERPAHGVGI